MKRLLSSILWVALPALPAVAQLEWDATGGNGQADDGAGNWDTTSNLWTADGGVSNTLWINGGDAVIGAGTGAAGTLTLTEAISAGLVTFNPPGSGNYTIDASAFDLTLNNGILANTGATLNGGVVLGADNTWNVASGQTLTANAILSGVGFGIDKTGDGRLELLGANSFDGTLTISAGVLRVNDDTNAFGASSIQLDGGVLEFRGDTNNVVYGRPLSVGGDAEILIDSESGISTGSRTYRLTTLDIGGQTLTVTRGGNMTGNANATVRINNGNNSTTLAGSPTFDVGNRATLVLRQVNETGGSRSITKNGQGTIVLEAGGNGNGSNYSGGTILNAGTIRLNGADSLGTGLIETFNNEDFQTTIDIRDPDSIARNDVILRATTGTNTATTLAIKSDTEGTVFNVNAVTVEAGRTLTINANRLASPNADKTLTFNAPVLFQGAGTFNAAGGNGYDLVFDGPDASFTTTSGTLNFNATSADLDMNQPITGGASLNFGGGNTQPGVLTLNAVNTYSGDSDISKRAGSVRLGIDNALPFGIGKGNFEMRPSSDTATFDLNGFSQTVNGFSTSSTGTSVIDNTAATDSTLTVGDNDGVGTFGGNLQDSGAGLLNLIKTGAGVIVLSGVNDYDGVTTINGGVLSFSNPQALYNGNAGDWTVDNIIVNSGATLSLGIGGPGEFTATDVDSIRSLGSATGGFQDGSAIGFDTSNAGGSFTYGSNIVDPNGGSNSLGVSKIGSGTLVLTGDNDFTGGGYLGGGILEFQNENGFGAGTYLLENSNSELSLNFTTTAPRTSSLGFTISDEGNNKTLRLSPTGAAEVTLTGDLVIEETTANNFDVRVGLDDVLTLTGNISGPGTLNVERPANADEGVLVLSGNNTQDGGTILNQRTTVRALSATALGDSATLNGNGPILEIADGLTLAASTPLVFTSTGTVPKIIQPVATATSAGVAGSLTLNQNTPGEELDTQLRTMTGQTLTVSGDISGPGGLEIVRFAFGNSGVVELSGNNTHAFGTQVSNAGTARALSPTAFGPSVLLQNSDSRIEIGQGITLASTTAIEVAETGGNKELALAPGATSGGVDSPITIDETGGQGFDLVTTPGQTLTVSGKISSSLANTTSGGISLTGGGVVFLSAANDYNGPTTVNDSGTLWINGDQSLANGDVSVTSGATLGGSGIIGGDTSFATGAIHRPGDGGAGLQTFTMDLEYLGASSILWELEGNTSSGRGIQFDGIDVTGNLTFSGTAALDLIFNNSASLVDWTAALWGADASWLLWDVEGVTTLGPLSINGSDWADADGDLLSDIRGPSSFDLRLDGNDVYLDYTFAVPEPSRAALLLIAGLGAVWRRRR